MQTQHPTRDAIEDMANTSACEWLGKWDEY